MDSSSTTELAEPASRPQTQVRTFLVADVRSYTRFTLDRGDEAAARLASRFATLMRDAVHARGGEVIELRGDEALAVFTSARQALHAAVEAQARFAEEAAALPEAPFLVGIGLDSGEAIPFEGGFRGTTLNLAARLCSLAGPGEVLASETLVNLTRKTEGLIYIERGPVQLKGFIEPVRVIEVRAGTGNAEAPSPAAAEAQSGTMELPLPLGGFLGSLPSGPMVAREEELTVIHAALDTVMDGTGQLVLLAGQRGAGKTRLGQEATLMAHKRGFLICTGRCYEAEQTVPFYAFLDVLAMAYAATPPTLRFQIPRRWPHLGPFLPEQLAAPTPDPSADPHEEQQRVIRAAAGFLATLAQERPLALLIDDLQWADEPSLRLLTHLARQCRGRSVFILGTYRDTDLQRDQPLDQALRELTRERLAERVTVRRLTAEGTAAMVAATVGDMETSEEFLEFVHRRTKGVPFFIEEILRSLGGHYRLIREIGAGGMGRVFQAVDTRTGHQVAAKIMFASKEAEASSAVRFEQEGAVLASLQHPNIVEVHGTFMEEHASCIVMELLRGQSLAELLRSEPPDLERTKTIMQQVASALVSAHGKGIVHRDIKPDNIMIEAGDLVKVTDFGIARILRPTLTLQTMGSTGMTLGTPLYMSPEQIDGRKVDGRADIYAVGAVLYQMVTGRPPFEGDDALTIAFKHVNEEPQPPRKVRPGVPREWEALILKALAKDPADRFQTAAALEASIAALSTEDSRKPVSAPSDSSEERRTPPAWRSRLRMLTPPPPTDPGGAVQVVGGSPVALPRQRADAVPAPTAARARRRRARGRRIGRAASRSVRMGAVVLLAVVLVAVWLLHASGTSSTSTGYRVAGIFQARAAGTFSAPNGVAIDGQGNIYVADQLTNHIQKLSASGQPLARWGSSGSGPGQLNAPWGVAVDRQGTIVYVADTTNNRILRFSSNGGYLGQIGQVGGGPGQLAAPYGIALDKQGNIYVADEGNSRVQELAPDGTFIRQWSHNFKYLQGLAVDSKGNVYVADSGTAHVEKLSPDGKFLRHLGRKGSRAPTFSSPTGVAIDPVNNVYVADQVNGTVQKLGPDGSLLATFATRGVNPGQIPSPQGIAIDLQGNVVVAEAGTHQVQQLSPIGRPLAQWKGTGAGVGLFQAPAGLEVDAHGAIYAADNINLGGLVYKLTSGGQLDPGWNTHGAAKGTYAFGGVALDMSGNVYVTDTVNGKVLMLSSKGVRLAQLDGNQSLVAPASVTVDKAGSIYIVDSGNDRIVKIDRKNRFLREVGAAGKGPAQFSNPQDIALDAAGNMYIVDSSNDVVQELSPTGQFITQWGTSGSGHGQFNSPMAITIASNGNVYVADTGNNRIQEFSPTGVFIATWGKRGSLPGQFNSPSGVAVDTQGNVYVADKDNHRIQKFAPTG